MESWEDKEWVESQRGKKKGISPLDLEMLFSYQISVDDAAGSGFNSFDLIWPASFNNIFNLSRSPSWKDSNCNPYRYFPQLPLAANSDQTPFTIPLIVFNSIPSMKRISIF